MNELCTVEDWIRGREDYQGDIRIEKYVCYRKKTNIFCSYHEELFCEI